MLDLLGKSHQIFRKASLMILVNELATKFKFIREFVRKSKPLKIVNIIEFSCVPGQTKFAIQICNKNSILKLTAAEIILNGYNLNLFSRFHSQMILEAAKGSLDEFLKLSIIKKPHTIVGKSLEKTSKQYVFTIKTSSGLYLRRTAEEIYSESSLLKNLNSEDLYQVAYIQGSESVLKEINEINLIKKSHSK